MVRFVDSGAGVVVEAVAHFTHILQQQQVAGFAAADDQVVKRLDREQVAVVFHQQGVGVSLIARGGGAAHQATDGGAVLRLHRVHHFTGGELIGRQFVGVNEQPVGGGAAAQDVHIGDPWHPLQGVIELFVDEPIQIRGVVLAFG